ncbi:AVID protein, partial [Anthoscopus minutus]|nr:AVID protein [Anthoscopus minutus]
MVPAAPFLLVLFLALGAHCLATELVPSRCNLSGNWKNDLGSNMTISQVNEKGDFFGIYYTAVSSTTKKIEPSPLLGSQKLPYQLYQPTFGFTVHWTFAESITVFTGQCFVDNDGKEILKTMWLLRSHVKKYEDDWEAT